MKLEELLEDVSTTTITHDAGWVRPNGGVLDLAQNGPYGQYAHADGFAYWVKKYDPEIFKRLNNEVKFKWEQHKTINGIMSIVSDEHVVSDFARSLGWVRYYIDRPYNRYAALYDIMIGFHYDYLTPQSARQCYKIVRQHRKLQPMCLEISDGDHSKIISYQEGLTFLMKHF